MRPGHAKDLLKLPVPEYTEGGESGWDGMEGTAADDVARPHLYLRLNHQSVYHYPEQVLIIVNLSRWDVQGHEAYVVQPNDHLVYELLWEACSFVIESLQLLLRC